MLDSVKQECSVNINMTVLRCKCPTRHARKDDGRIVYKQVGEYNLLHRGSAITACFYCFTVITIQIRNGVLSLHLVNSLTWF